MTKFKALVYEAVSRLQAAIALEMLAEDASLEAASALEVLAEAASCLEAASALEVLAEAASCLEAASALEVLAEAEAEAEAAAASCLEAASALEMLAEAASCLEAASALMSVTELQCLIRKKGGHDSKCIMIKTLFETDVDMAQNRLSMPLKQISDDDFLNRDEKMILNGATKNGIVVGFIGPRCEETTMVLKKRNFTRSSSYVLIENWHKIAMNNGLKKGDTVQVWFFRVDDRPWFALVKPANLNHI